MSDEDYDYIHPSLREMAIDIDLLDALPGNPRVGDIDAIAASLEQFGQIKPIVVHPNGDGRFTILAGNHTTEAARSLGWTHIACVVGEDMDETEAAAFALVDNRVAEIGYTDESLLTEFIVDVADVYPELLESVGWDDFEIASITMASSNSQYDDGESRRGFVAPQIETNMAPVATRTQDMEPTVKPITVEDLSSDSGTRLVAPEGTDTLSTVIAGVGGATSQNVNARKAQMQYSLVFDDASQMGRWWDFIRFLRSSPVYDGETIAEKIMNFAEVHGEF